MSAAAQTASTEPGSWDNTPAATRYQTSLSAATPSVMPKTVDYGHGHGMSSKDVHIRPLTDETG